MSWFNYKGHHKNEKTVADWNAPLPERDERRLESLYAWERRLRGYDLYPAPVALEPAFVAYDPTEDACSSSWQSVPQPRDSWADDVDNDGRSRKLVFSELRLPMEQKVSPLQTAELFGALRGLAAPLALEIVADSRAIHYQIACAPGDAETVLAACVHCFPQAVLQAGSAHNNHFGVGNDALLDLFAPLAERSAMPCVIDFGLHDPVYYPLPLFESFAVDPHAPLMGGLGDLQDGEVAGIQLLLSPASARWVESLALLVAQFDGVVQPAHPNTRENELERGLRHKLASPLWAVALRIYAVVAGDGKSRGDESSNIDGRASVSTTEKAFALCRRVGMAFCSGAADGGSGDALAGRSAVNSLLALDDSGYGLREKVDDLLKRRSRRTGMLLSSAELAGLWHPPSERLTHPRLLRYNPRYRELPPHLKEAPGVALGLLAQPGVGGAAGGESLGRGNTLLESPLQEEPQIVLWPDAMRPRHLYMLGATRMGKSTMLLNLIAQDLLDGRGLCLIDPHGDLALDVLRRVPPEREDDVLYLDLSDTAHPPALGLLEAADEWEKRLLVSDLLAILHRLFRSSWGDRLEHILRHALLTLLAAQVSPFGTPLTLRDIRPLLSSKAYRDQLLENVPDLDLRTFWHSEFPGYASSAFAPVYNKLGLLLSSPLVRNIVGGGQSRLHAGRLMQHRRVLLVNLAQSLIGEDNAHFLGALLVSKIQLAAMHNLRLGREERAPFTLYVDEFQNFVVSSFGKILSEAGKAGLTLVMANQFLEQLGEELPTAIRSNVGTLISFRVSAQSGRVLEGEFGGHYGARELTDLERGQAVARLGKAGDSFLLHTFPPLQPETVGARHGAPQRIAVRTQAEVCRERGEVEAELRTADEALHRLLEEATAEQAARHGKGRGAKDTTARKNAGDSPKATSRKQAASAGDGEETADNDEESASVSMEENGISSSPRRRLRTVPVGAGRRARTRQKAPPASAPASQRAPLATESGRTQPVSEPEDWPIPRGVTPADESMEAQPEPMPAPPIAPAPKDVLGTMESGQLPAGSETTRPPLFFGVPDEPEDDEMAGDDDADNNSWPVP